jgi:hypothetical protein
VDGYKWNWYVSSTFPISILSIVAYQLLILYPTAFFVTGHACWATDFYACDGLRELRRNIGMPWAAVLELHGLYARLVLSEKTHC